MKNIYRAIIEQSPISIIITDIEGRINYVNPKFVELTGYQAEEVIGKTPRILKSGETSLQEYSNLWETILSGNVWKGEFVNRKKNGELYNEAAVISPIKDENGNITGLIGLKEDITDLKKARQQLLKGEKVKDILKTVSYVFHEIKSPLTSMKINIDMLLRNNNLPENANRSLSIMQSEIVRLYNLLKNIIDYSKDQELNCTEINLREFFDFIYTVFAPQLEESGIKFVNNARDIKILGDVQRLKSVFILLIENSISALSEEGIIEINSAENNKHCSIFIKDNGCGIINKENIFEPFYTTKKNGTGLGLVIAKDIIEKHGGGIKLLSSKPGETVFEVILNREN